MSAKWVIFEYKVQEIVNKGGVESLGKDGFDDH